MIINIFTPPNSFREYMANEGATIDHQNKQHPAIRYVLRIFFGWQHDLTVWLAEAKVFD